MGMIGKISKVFEKVDKWMMDQLYEIYPHLTQHMKKPKK
jgi:hypothetical protein